MTTKFCRVLTSGQEQGLERKRLSGHQHPVVFFWEKSFFSVNAFHFIFIVGNEICKNKLSKNWTETKVSFSILYS